MWTLSMKEIIEATGGKLIYGSPNGIAGISIDSRRIEEGELFIAIKGDRFDGHDFLMEALDRACCALVSIPPANAPKGKVIVHVENTLRALHDIARYLRRKCRTRVVGITGTNGKTTTKEMTAAILSTRLNVLKTSGNLNNQVGLPLSLLNLTPRHDAAVLEMGASALGDIKELCSIAEPDFGVLTNIGHAHIQGFKDIGTVRSAKMELLESVKAAAVNADDEFLLEGLRGVSCRVIKFGTKDNADVRASDIRLEARSLSFTLSVGGADVEVKLRTTGMFNVYNALAAASAATMFGITPDDIQRGLESFAGVPMRLEIKDYEGCTIISDLYNANPSSMEEALKELIRLKGKRAVAVLGDMLELGSYAEAAHRKIGSWMVEYGVDVFIAVGELMGLAAEEFAKSGRPTLRAATADEARALLDDFCAAGDTVLVKGSRSMTMERVLEGRAICNGRAGANAV